MKALKKVKIWPNLQTDKSKNPVKALIFFKLFYIKVSDMNTLVDS